MTGPDTIIYNMYQASSWLVGTGLTLWWCFCLRGAATLRGLLFRPPEVGAASHHVGYSGGLARGLACASAPFWAPSGAGGCKMVLQLVVTIGYFFLIACCNFIVAHIPPTCKNNFVPFASIFVPGGSTFIPPVLATKMAGFPGQKLQLYIKVPCSDFLLQFCTICGII